jgi:predicted glycosyltransferase
MYFENVDKQERVLFFLGDHDHHKTILSQPEFFKSFEMELLLGHYFFVKYEDDLAKLFERLHEPEEYTELITQSTTVVTAAAQTALEAKAGGAKVIYITTDAAPLYPVELLGEYGIHVVEGFDAAALREALTQESPEPQKRLKPYQYGKITELL